MRTRRLSVVLATPPGFNPGMAATELGLRAFLRRSGLEEDAQCYRLMPFTDRLGYLAPRERAEVERRADTGLHALSAVRRYDDIASSAAVLFWADYLHMGVYLREMAGVLSPHLGASEADAERTLRRVLLLEHAGDDTLARTLSFGTTLLFNTPLDERGAYGAALRRFVTGAKRMWVRDALSAARVAHLRDDYETGFFGVDCAQLLTRDDIEAFGARRATHRPGSVLAFFGRERQFAEALHGVARDVATALGCPVHALPWGDAGGFPQLDGVPPSADGADADVHDLLRAVAGARAVVTDTYHLALAAWNAGVPAICAFAGHVAQEQDVSSGREFAWRDKREIFYSQYDALDFLIRPEELRDPGLLRRRIDHVRSGLADAPLCAAITERMRAHAVAAERALAREVHALLSPVIAR